MFETEHLFELPKGYVDKEGNLHRRGSMRLATAADEILPMKDPRVQALPAYLIVILLARVIVRLGSLPEVNPGVIEGLFTEDLAYLQDLYNRLNGLAPRLAPVRCPQCQHQFETEVVAAGGGSRLPLAPGLPGGSLPRLPRALDPCGVAEPGSRRTAALDRRSGCVGACMLERDALERITTAGQRMAGEARRVFERRAPALAWLELLGPLLRRIGALPTPGNSPYQRVERPEAAGYGWAQPPAAEPEELWKEPTPLAPEVRLRLRELAGPGVEAMRLHDDEHADALAVLHHADAVTVGQDVFFRRGQLRPHEDTGFALLAHEAVHVAEALQPNAAWRLAVAGGSREGERRAATVEATALAWRRHGAPPDAPLLPPRVSVAPAWTGAPAAASPSPSSPVLRPAAAPTDRPPQELAANAPPGMGFEELRDALYRDLMTQFRADFERGG